MDDQYVRGWYDALAEFKTLALQDVKTYEVAALGAAESGDPKRAAKWKDYANRVRQAVDLVKDLHPKER